MPEILVVESEGKEGKETLSKRMTEVGEEERDEVDGVSCKDIRSWTSISSITAIPFNVQVRSILNHPSSPPDWSRTSV